MGSLSIVAFCSHYGFESDSMNGFMRSRFDHLMIHDVDEEEHLARCGSAHALSITVHGAAESLSMPTLELAADSIHGIPTKYFGRS